MLIVVLTITNHRTPCLLYLPLTLPLQPAQVQGDRNNNKDLCLQFAKRKKNRGEQNKEITMIKCLY